ncbi:MAG: ATP-binding protein [Muribaculaceae bacterium]|nr:ATP-binding protein [Muribaculaceae bacterium]
MAKTKREQMLFDELHNIRVNQSKVINSFAMRGIKQSVIDLYNQKAHFLYELLQNADDAKAGNVTFELYKDHLVFRHNGSIRFTISEEKENAKPYGHINAITAIGFSGKQSEEDEGNKIGKFGIGFKAIYQYSSTPEIYNDKFCFKIENFVIPVLLNKDYNGRQKGETIFIFPFDNPKFAYNDIKQKLVELDNPVLFLRNLYSVKIIIEGKYFGTYLKTIKYSATHGDIEHSLIELNYPNKNQLLHLFTHEIEINGECKENYFISVGYFLTEEDKLDISRRPNIFCFFPTSEKIGEVCCICHAPFELVNNRQQLKETTLNKNLKGMLAEIAAKALPILRDYYLQKKKRIFNSNIIKLIPKERYRVYWGFNDEEDDDQIFRKKYIDIIRHSPLLLSDKNQYILPQYLYVASSKALSNLIDDLQLKYLFGNNASQVSHSIREFANKNEGINSLLTSQLKVNDLTIINFLEKINDKFMDTQTYDWVKRLYNYLHKNEHEAWDLSSGEEFVNYIALLSPIVKTSTGEWIAPFNENGNQQVYLPIKGNKDDHYRFVNEEYLKEDITRNFIKAIGITAPDSWAFINSVIFKKCNEDNISDEDIKEYFEFIYLYIRDLEGTEKEEKIEEIKNNFVVSVSKDSFSRLTEVIYYDDAHLKEFLRDNDVEFIYSPDYGDFRKKYHSEEYIAYLKDLGIKFSPQIKKIESKVWHFYGEKKKFDIPSYSTDNYIVDYQMTGLKDYITSPTKTYVSSLALWNWLLALNLKEYRYARARYKYYSWHHLAPVNSDLYDNLMKKWIVLKDGKTYSPSELFLEDLEKSDYPINDSIIEFLSLKKRERDKEERGLTEEEESKYQLGRIASEYGITEEKLIKILEEEKKKEALASLNNGTLDLEEKKKGNIELQESDNKNRLIEKSKRKESKELKGSDFDSPDNERAKSSNRTQTQNKKSIEDILNGFEEKAKIQKEELEKVASIRERIESAPKYSYEWLTSLMELEVQSQGTSGASGKKALYISFDAINFSSKDEQILILSEPSRYIPGVLEDIDSLPITFGFNNGTNEKFSFDSASVKNDALILKSGLNNKKSVDLIRKNVNLISHAFIEVNEPIDILKNWQTTINGMDLEPEFSLKEFLRNDLEFIFGPPGTGKTTTLSNRINGLIQEAKGEIKILVLAPTNKACDVLTRKLLEISDGSDDWIWRFVKTDDPYIEEEELVYGRESQLGRQKKVCVISTIERYAFDGFNDGDLKSLEWDYVFIDEASMIPLYKILPPLYNPAIKKVIISGDPFQIEPIVNIDLWKGENIYTMVKLEDFVNPKTEPFPFKVTPLMTQYRSIPSIGELFSGYLYGSKLSHYRKSSDHRILNLGVSENPLNVISFPVDRESIFDLKRLSGSNIQIYSVLFTVEFLKYLTKNLKKNHAGELVKIGIISPYSAEIQAIQKIYNQSCIADDNIEVVFGSAHGFQGDQCDIIIAVINPPASGLKRAADMTFVNNKNILNVAISRASDYLFLLIPQKDYENFDSLYEIKKIGKKMTSLKCSFSTSDKIESLMFGKSHHIENNTFVTSHKMTNVFNNPFTKYEIRIDENAIDIQINS